MIRKLLHKVLVKVPRLVPKESKDSFTYGYLIGLRTGIKEYAHWKNGVEHVGTCGQTYTEAVKVINEEVDSIESLLTLEDLQQQKTLGGSNDVSR